jgi:hypothetical protein
MILTNQISYSQRYPLSLHKIGHKKKNLLTLTDAIFGAMNIYVPVTGIFFLERVLDKRHAVPKSAADIK